MHKLHLFSPLNCLVANKVSLQVVSAHYTVRVYTPLCTTILALDGDRPKLFSRQRLTHDHKVPTIFPTVNFLNLPYKSLIRPLILISSLYISIFWPSSLVRSLPTVTLLHSVTTLLQTNPDSFIRERRKKRRIWGHELIFNWECERFQVILQS